MFKQYLKEMLPDKYVKRMKQAMVRRTQHRLRGLPFSGDDLRWVMKDVLRLKKGDVVFVHSSMDGLAMDWSARDILYLLLDVIGSEGTIIMPSYPHLTSYLFLKRGQTWDVRRTPSYMGLITEIFRRMEGTRRSLHPTKSVAVRGPLRDELISEHHLSEWPYAAGSPYFKFVQQGGKAIGLGVNAQYMAFVHTIDDYLAEAFPHKVYHDDVFIGKVIDYAGHQRKIPTLAHDLNRMKYNTHCFLQTYFRKEEAVSLRYKGRDFFCADAGVVFKKGVALAKQGVTIYTKRMRSVAI